MKGYKVFNPNWTCRDFQYEVGKTYELDGELEMCKNGFHFCKELRNCFNYYSLYDNIKIAEIEAIGDIIESSKDSKCCTNKIKIVREIDFDEMCEIIGHDKRVLRLFITLYKFLFFDINGTMPPKGKFYSRYFCWNICFRSSTFERSIRTLLCNNNLIRIKMIDWSTRKDIDILIGDNGIVYNENEDALKLCWISEIIKDIKQFIRNY